MKKITKKNMDSIMKEIFEKKGHSIICIDLRKFDAITDFFVICSGESEYHTKGIAEHLLQKIGEKYGLHHIEGFEHGHWILLDFVDFIIHIFLDDVRKFYNIEKFWGDAPYWEYNEK